MSRGKRVYVSCSPHPDVSHTLLRKEWQPFLRGSKDRAGRSVVTTVGYVPRHAVYMPGEYTRAAMAAVVEHTH